MQTRTNIAITCLAGLAIFAIFLLRGAPPEPAPPLGMERVPPGEASAIAALVRSFSAAASAPQPEYACLRARFTVIDNLAADLAHGVFEPGIQYPVWVRISRTVPRPPPATPPVFGLAIQLHGVNGNAGENGDAEPITQDFLLTSEAVFPYADVAAYAEAVANGRATVPSANLIGSVPGVAPYPSSVPGGPFSGRWWGVLPYRFGSARVVKYALRACPVPEARTPPAAASESFVDQIYRAVEAGGLCYEFMLQFQSDAQKMPVENANVLWDETLAPFEPVALLTVPAQVADGTAHAATCDALSFDPWHALPQHQPLGGINRLQRALHQAVSER